MRGAVRQLRAFRGLTHDPQGILTAVQRDTLVGVKGGFNLVFGVSFCRPSKLELRIAAFADSNSWQRVLDDSELAARHVQSLAHREETA
jgi:hypothetical protein